MYYHPKVPRGANSGEIADSECTDEVFELVLEPSKERFVAVRRLLVPIDASEGGRALAFRAIAYLIRSAEASSAEVHLISVQRLVMQGDFALDVAVGAECRARAAEAQEVLDRARALLCQAGARCRTAVLFGDPARAIARYAKEHACEAILMGTRGLGSIRGLLHRSVAAQVVSLTDVPVTLVKSVVSGLPASDREQTTRSSVGSHVRNQLR
jgi:nucleotide-binding universal stress UspA family protein